MRRRPQVDTEAPDYLAFLPAFGPAIKSGRKTVTTRASKLAEGIYRTIFGDVRITASRQLPLKDVRDVYWREEGLPSREDFEAVWVETHPRIGFRSEQLVWVHDIEYLEGV